MELQINPAAWPESIAYDGSTYEPKMESPAYSPSDPRILEMWGQDELMGNAALNLSAFFSGVCLISEAKAILPIKVYKETKAGTWDYQDQHPTNQCFQQTVNGWQTPSVYKSMSMMHKLMSGNSISAITRNARGQGMFLKSFLPINTRFYVKKNGDPRYSLRDAPWADNDGVLMVAGGINNAEYKYYEYDEILHEKAFGMNGYVGMSVLKVARNSLDFTHTIEKFGQKYFSKGRPAGFITKDGKLNPKQVEVIREEWAELQQGVMNAFNVGILHGGLRWEPIGYTNEDAQFLQSRAYQVLEIARWLRIPPHMLAQLDKATNSNIEQLMLEFIIHTMLPWVVRSEEEINLKMFTPKERAMGFQCFYDVDAFLRGDTLTRATVEEKDIRNGVRTITQIRNARKFPAYENQLGDQPLVMASQLDTLKNVQDGTSMLHGYIPPGQTKPSDKGKATDGK